MATAGNRINYSDISTAISNTAAAYRKVLGSTWSSSIRQGGLLSYSDLSAIDTAGRAAEARYNTGSNRFTHASCNSNRSHSTSKSNDSFGSFTNNKCGGEGYQAWRHVLHIGLI